jgi:phosphate transport system substrate-binding protein
MLSRTWWLLALVAALTAVEAEPQPIIIVGVDAIAPVLRDVVAGYLTDHPTRRITIHVAKEGQALAAVASQAAHVAMLPRSLTPIEAAAAEWSVHPIAREGLGFVVHVNNPLTDLTKAQALAVYTGGIVNWSALGGESGMIRVLSTSGARPDRNWFCDYFAVRPQDLKPHVVLASDDQALQLVLANRGAIVYVPILDAEVAIDDGQPLRLVTLAGIPASSDAVADGSYPLTRTCTMYGVGDDSPALKDFLDYVASDPSHERIRAHGWIPIR